VNTTPEKWDAEFWTGVFKIVARLAVVGAAVIAGSGGLEMSADSGLRDVEYADAKDNVRIQCGEDLQAMMLEEEREQSRCDMALDGFARHRNDEEEWANVLRECHSGEAE
jgi:hypothetical protein